MHKEKSLFAGFFRMVSILFLALLLAAFLFFGCDQDPDKGEEEEEITVDAANSSITVDPPVIPSDGESEATVTVTLADKRGEPVSDEQVTLWTTKGEIISANPVSLGEFDYGRAEFTLRSSTSSGRVTLSLPGFPDISAAEMVFGSIGSGYPASIRVESVHPSEIAVTGTGQPDTATVSIRVVDESGDTIEDSGYTLKASFLARPNGVGEQLSEAKLDTDNKDPDKIEMSLENGAAWLNVKSGNIPGALEVLLELLENGQPLDPPVKTVIPQISIASGPPHILSLSAPQWDAVVDLNTGSDEGIPQTPGFYSRTAGLSVLDRWGNAVPDGTVINIGVMDTVLSAGNTGSIGENSDVFTDTGASFYQDSVTRNNTRRFIEPGDRVLLKNAKAQNKSRSVARHPESGSPGELDVNRVYKDDESGLEYVVGASMLGASIYGISQEGEATKGTVTTHNGLGKIRLVYPANANTILVGHVSDDPRHPPSGSARVITVFSTSDDTATMVDEGTLGFSSIAGWTLSASPESISGTDDIFLRVVDGGDEVPLPFINVRGRVTAIDRDDESDLEVSVSDCQTHSPATGPAGGCWSTITIRGEDIVSGDSAEITYSAGDADDVTVSYEAP